MKPAMLHVVTGKGGVGKSSVAAALALAAARDGERVLALELGGPGGLADLLDARPVEHGVAVPARGDVLVAYVDGAEALAEYLRGRVPFGGLLDAAFEHPLYHAFVSAGPGVRELMAVGKVRDELLGLSTHGPRWDRIVLDAGASGHALQLLGMPAATARAFTSGLAHREASRVARTLADPERTAVHVVALPEKMPLEEAAHVVESLRELGLPIGRLVINQCRPRAPAGAVELVDALAAEAAGTTESAVAAVGRRTLAWLRLQEDGIAGLEARLGAAVERLPRLHASRFGHAELERLARALARNAAGDTIQADPEELPDEPADAEPGPSAEGARPERPSLADVLDRHRVVVCVGTGGVGKTTIAASLALAGAMKGRRAMVLTIDPARQLARALGLDGLASAAEPVPLDELPPGGGSLHAGMLDAKVAWDAFITRHAPTPEVRERLLGNRFYRQLSTSMAGSTEYMAMEELCRLDEEGRFDLIVIDTPPAAHALDFLRAPERIESLLDPRVVSWIARPYRALGRGAVGASTRVVRSVLRQLRWAAGRRTLRDISAFFVALDELFGDMKGRTERAHRLLGGPGTAFVLVAGPGERVLGQGDALRASIAALRVRLRATVINRVHPLSASVHSAAATAPALLTELARRGMGPAPLAWLRHAWSDALAAERAERRRLAGLAATLAPEVAWAEVPELDHDAHSLRDVERIARELGLAGSRGHVLDSLPT